MKTRILIYSTVIFFGLLTSCESDDEPTFEETIQGTWNLKNVRGGLLGIDMDYNAGDVKWVFDKAGGNLIIENNILTTGPEDIYAGLDSGTYDYEIQQAGDRQTLYIENSVRGVLIILGDNLTIDDGIDADGFITEFER